jgi:hypothetical protein
MAGRDLSAELFSAPAPSSEGRDLSTDLFGEAPVPKGRVAEMKAFEPSFFEEIKNVGRRGLLQAEETKYALAFQSGLIDAATYAERMRVLNRKRGAAAPSGDVAAGLDRLQKANETESYAEVAKEIIKPKNWKALASLVAESAVGTAETIPATVAGGVIAGPPGAAAAAGASSFAAEFGATIGDLLEKKGVDASDPLAVRALLEDPKFISEARERGLKRGIPIAAFDALSAGFAGRFIRALNKGTGAISRKATVKASAKEAGVQVGSGMAGEASGQALTGEVKPLDVFIEGLAELPGGVAEVATGARKRGPRTEETTPTTEGKDLSADLFGEAPVKERIEPTLDDAALTPAVTPEKVRADRIAELTEIYKQQGTPEENAGNIAARKVDAELKAEAKTAAIKVPEGRVDQITQDLIAAGVDPQQAKIDAQLLAQEEAEADELAKTETGGAATVAGPISQPTGEGVSVAGQPSAELPTGGPAGVEPSGMVPAGQDVANAPAGERVKPLTLEERLFPEETKPAAVVEAPAPAAVEEAPKDRLVTTQDGEPWTYFYPGAEVVQSAFAGAPAKVVGVEEKRGQPTLYKLEVDVSNHPDGVDDNGDRVNTKTVTVTDEELNRLNPPTTPEGTPSGTETIEAVEATQEGQEAPAAGVTKRGRKAAPAEVKEQKKLTRNEQNRINNDADYKLKKYAAQLEQTLTPEQIEELSLEEAEQAEIDARQSRRSALRGLIELQGNPNIARGSAVGKRISAALKASKATEAELADIRRGMKAAEEVLTGPKEDVLGSAATRASEAVVGNRPTAMRSAEAKVGKADTGFNNIATGAQAVSYIVKTGNGFQRLVAQRIRNYMAGVKFVVVEKGDPMPSQLRGARGLFEYTPSTNERTIYVRGSSFGSQQGINTVTVLHELLHAATASRIAAGTKAGAKNPQLQKFVGEMQSLMKRAQEAYEEGVLFGELSADVQDMIEATANIDDKTGNVTFDVFADPNEFLAYGMSSPTFQSFLMSVEGTQKEETAFSKFVRAILDLFGLGKGNFTALSDLVNITDKMLDEQATTVAGPQAFQQKGKFTPPEFDEQADIKAKRSALQLAKEVKIAKEKVRLSREGELTKNVELMQLARDPKAVREILANATDALGYAKLQASVRLPTFDFLAKWAADVGIPALSETNTQLQRMLGMSQQFLAGAEQVIGSMNRGFEEDPKLNRQKFSDFVYATTLAEVDPSDPNAREVEVERKEKKTKKGAKPEPKTTTLAADYKALGPVGQRMYKQLRDYYEMVIELYSDLLDEQINNIPGMAPEEKTNLMAVLRKTFEAEARIKPFFPLVRRGDYWLAIGSGENRLFYIFETRAERNAKAKELAASRGEDYEDALFRQEFTQGNDLKTLRAASQNSSEMLKKVFEAIDSKDLGSPSAKEGLKDAIYQVYLTTMPEQSFRRQFTHRKGRAGFSTDLQRNIATTASKQSIQLARLKYAPKLRNSLSAARDSILEREELSPFVQEAEKRIDMALSGDHGSLSESVAGIANKASYFWYLSSAASALIQPSSVFISGLPVLAGNYNNVTGAAAELAKMTTLVNQYSVYRTNVDGTTSISAPSIANNKSLPADERKAISEMTSRGVSESTYASLVWGYKSMSTEQFEGVAGKGKRIANLMVGALMHNTERLSREAVYLAAYRLGKKEGLARGLTIEQVYDAAVQKAVDSTNEALGNYDVTNRPRFMQQGIGKIAFQFKTYPLQMSLLLLTNFKKMLPFLNKEGKKEAVTKFFGMMGTSFLLAGAANMALFSPIMGLVGWAWSQLELDDDWPEELKDLDFETWFRTVFLPENLGDVTLGGVPVSDIVDRGPLNAITGYDIGSRIGLNDLWGRDSKETKTSRESAIAFMLDHFGGPTASLMLGFADAYDAFAMGDYQKMLEKMLPAAARNLVVANKYADEGMKTARGSELVGKDDVKTGELIGQAIGFRPDILAATQGPSFKLTGVEQKILNQRGLILNKLAFQHRKETDEGDDKFADIMENEVSKFNKKYPSYALDADAIIDSLVKKAEQRASARAGVNITEKNVGIVDDAVTNLEKRLEKREEQMKAQREKNPR